MKNLTPAILAVACLLLSAALSAENSTRTGGYTIHHNALTTDVLPAQVASAYHIPRSPGRALLNVSVLRDEVGTLGTPVRAQIRAVARTLFGQLRTLEMTEVIEPPAIYYIAHFPVDHRETLTFEMEIIPEGERRALTATLRQEFWTD
jgi:hypothetical protein